MNNSFINRILARFIIVKWGSASIGMFDGLLPFPQGWTVAPFDVVEMEKTWGLWGQLSFGTAQKKAALAASKQNGHVVVTSPQLNTLGTPFGRPWASRLI
jgi:hypothetical protein